MTLKSDPKTNLNLSGSEKWLCELILNPDPKNTSPYLYLCMIKENRHLFRKKNSLLGTIIKTVKKIWYHIRIFRILEIRIEHWNGKGVIHEISECRSQKKAQFGGLNVDLGSKVTST